MILFIYFFICIQTGYSFMSTYPPYSEPSVIADIIDTKNFVDKSDFLKLFFESDESDLLQMVAAPHNFGKTAVMDLIKKFSEITVTENGEKIARHKTHNFKFFDRYKLKVFEDKLFLFNQFGMYPVVRIDFSKLHVYNYAAFIRSFKELIRMAHRDHLYLLLNDTLGIKPNPHFRKNYDRASLKYLPLEELPYSIMSLEHLLYKYYKDRKCIFLIDGYDELIRNVIFEPTDDAFQILNFTLEYVSFNVLTSPFLIRAYINSCIRLRPDIPDDPINITHIPFLTNQKFTPYYGFSEEEVKTLLAKENMTDMLDEIRKWYGGYKVRNSTVSLFNPFSVVSYLKYKTFESFWTEAGVIKNTEKIFSQNYIKEKINQVLNENSTTIGYLSYLNISHVLQLKSIIENPENVYDQEDIDLFMQFMTDQGYFIIVSAEPNSAVRIQIPNQEIREFFAQIKEQETSE